MSDDPTFEMQPVSWRDQSYDSSARGSRRWRLREKETGSGNRARWRYWGSRIGLLVGIASAIGVLAWLWKFWNNPEWSTTVLIYADSYEDVPESAYARLFNPYARRDGKMLEDRLNELKTRYDENRTNQKVKVKKINEFKQIAENANESQVLIVYVNALAVRSSDDKNVIVLFDEKFAHPDLGRADSGEPLETLWTQLGDPALENVSKVVLLDLKRPEIDWRAGIFPNRVVNPEYFKEATTGIKNIAVFCSAGPHERSWTSGPLGNSVFAHFAARALLGEADERDSFDAKTRSEDQVQGLRLKEFVSFVQKQTAAWAERQRDDHQNPWLYIRDADGEEKQLTALSDDENVMLFKSFPDGAGPDISTLQRPDPSWTSEREQTNGLRQADEKLLDSLWDKLDASFRNARDEHLKNLALAAQSPDGKGFDPSDILIHRLKPIGWRGLYEQLMLAEDFFTPTNGNVPRPFSRTRKRR